MDLQLWLSTDLLLLELTGSFFPFKMSLFLIHKIAIVVKRKAIAVFFSEQVYGTIMEVLKREELGAERKTISLDEAVPLIQKEED